MADLDSIGRSLSIARRDRTLVGAEGQCPDPHGNAGELPNAATSGQAIRHRPEIEHTHRQERKLLDKTQIEGITYEPTHHKITNHHPHGSRTDRHAATMRGLSACSREIEQASHSLGNAGSSGGSPFERARKAVVESINEIANHIETIALRMKQFIFRAPAEDDDVAKASEISSDDVGY